MKNSPHIKGCNIGRCKEHGNQWSSCNANGTHSPTTYTGEFPGSSEAIARGWFTVRENGVWVGCEAGTPGAQPDLNRVMSELTWDSESESFC